MQVNISNKLLWSGMYSELCLTKESENILKNSDELFKWENGFIFDKSDNLKIYLIDSPSKIDSKNINITMDCDVWFNG